MVLDEGNPLPSLIRTVRERLSVIISRDDAEVNDSSSLDCTRTEEAALDSVLYEARGCSKAEVMAETGLAPEEYIAGLIDGHGGRLKQRQLVSFTTWTSPTMSRLLQQMEDDGEIVRVKVGHEKLVCLPGELPRAARTSLDSDDGSDDSHR